MYLVYQGGGHTALAQAVNLGNDGGLSGVLISVTTGTAPGNVALGLAFGAWSEVRGSGLQLLLNLSGMVLAGWATLAFQQAAWGRASARRATLAQARRARRGR